MSRSRALPLSALGPVALGLVALGVLALGLVALGPRTAPWIGGALAGVCTGCARVETWADDTLREAFDVVEPQPAAGATAPAPGPGRPSDDAPPAAPRAPEKYLAKLSALTAETAPSENDLDGKWPEPTEEELAALEVELETRMDATGATRATGAAGATGATGATRATRATGATGATGAADGTTRHAIARAAYTPPDVIDPDRALVATAQEAIVFSRPSFRSKKLGYLRAGAVIPRADTAASFLKCPKGWYAVEPEGFVCIGRTASLDVNHPITRAAGVRADRHAPLPYRYGISKFPTSPLYARVPTVAQQKSTEQDYRAQMRRNKWRDDWKDAELAPIPEFLAGGAPVPSVNGYVHSTRTVYTGRAMVQSGFAFAHLFESDGRKFGLSVDLNVLALDRLEPVKLSEFGGVQLGGDVTLPLVFVHTRAGVLLEGDPKVGLKAGRRLAFREAVPITGKKIRIGNVRYLETKDGHWLRDIHLVRVNPMKKRPSWARPGYTWIDISILRQTLVAYEGTEPVFATLVSTGAAGLGDPEKTAATVRGRFLIHTKHVTATMDNDEDGDQFDLRDVPYVQYFTEGYALHAAYWHNSFGRPRSHGCINLAPRDAQWLFEWSDPPVPEKWHGAMSLREGTLVNVHP